MKPPFVISQFKWLPFPENKPENWDCLCLCKTNSTSPTIIYEALYEDSNNTFWADDGTQSGNDITKDVVGFALKPTVDLDSEEFDFSTALELMKEGIKCLSESLNTWKIENGTFWKATNTGWVTDLPYHNEILNKWRLAE